MFDIGWSEMLMIIVVMIIVIGPKDLPGALHTLGQWVGKIRRTARHFQDTIEQAAQQAGLDEARKEIRNLTNMNIGNEIEKHIDPKGEMREALNIPAPDFNMPDGTATLSNKTASDKPALEKPAAPKPKEGDAP